MCDLVNMIHFLFLFLSLLFLFLSFFSHYFSLLYLLHDISYFYYGVLTSNVFKVMKFIEFYRF